jgi:hypothetical protein
MTTRIFQSEKTSGFVNCCDFCAATEKQVGLLIASPTGNHICNRCVADCGEIVAEWVESREVTP